MRFGTPEADAFRDEVKAWFTENLPQGWGTPEFVAPQSEEGVNEFLRSWQRTIYGGGWAGLSWPVEYGGRGAGLVEQAIFLEQRDRVKAPPEIGMVSIGMVGPMLLHHGTEEQKHRFLKPMLTGDEVWCQGFSEPGAGSDLAALRTRAERDGDEYIVSGQKVWTSRAAIAEYMILLARTDPYATKHSGISAFAVPMDTHGIEVRPINQVNGMSEFSEVFFDGVRVPCSALIGEENDGWRVAITTLMYERVATTRAFECQRMLSDVLDLARQRGSDGIAPANDPVVMDRIALLFAEVQAARISYFRLVTHVERTGTAGPEASSGKLHTSELTQRISDLGLRVEGVGGLVGRVRPALGEPTSWAFEYTTALKNTIAAGTTQVQRNIIGDRVLGLPR